MKIAIAVAACLVALAGCKDYGGCLESHTDYWPQFVPVGDTQFVILVPQETCDRYEFPEGR